MILTGEIHSPETKRLFWILFALTILALFGMQLTGAPLKTEIAQGGIITFELVGTLTGSQGIIESWQGTTMVWAGINIGLDFLFLFLYATTISLGCLILANKMPKNLHALSVLGVWLARGVILAAILDIVENIALILLLTGYKSEFLPQLARSVALPKFGLVFLALLYIVSAALIDGMNKYDKSHETL